jgi:hypothetical protein
MAQPTIRDRLKTDLDSTGIAAFQRPRLDWRQRRAGGEI